MPEDKPKPKLDARGRASVFHFIDGWIKRQPIDCRDIVQHGQGAAVPSMPQFVRWWDGLTEAQKAQAVTWPEDAGPEPRWLPSVIAPPPPAPSEFAPVAPPAPSDFVDEVAPNAAPPKPKK